MKFRYATGQYQAVSGSVTRPGFDAFVLQAEHGQSRTCKENSQGRLKHSKQHCMQPLAGSNLGKLF